MTSTHLLDRLVSRILEKRPNANEVEIRKELAAESARLLVTEAAVALLMLHRAGEDSAGWARELEAELARSADPSEMAERSRSHPRDDEA